MKFDLSMINNDDQLLIIKSCWHLNFPIVDSLGLRSINTLPEEFTDLKYKIKFNSKIV